MRKKKGLSMIEKSNVEERVNKIRKEFSDILSENNFDIVKFAKELGFVVGNARLKDSDDGFILINPKNDIGNLKTNKVIGVNQNRSLEKKRFIIAHELGHYFLNSNEGAIVYAHRERHDTTQEEEDIVDYFAACFLMPRENFLSRQEHYESEVKQGKIDKNSITRKLAADFGVDEGAIIKRREELRG